MAELINCDYCEKVSEKTNSNWFIVQRMNEKERPRHVCPECWFNSRVFRNREEMHKAVAGAVAESLRLTAISQVGDIMRDILREMTEKFISEAIWNSPKQEKTGE